MSWPVTNTSRIHVTGTSLTQLNTPTGNWQGRPGSLIDQLRAKGIVFTPAASSVYQPAKAGQGIPSSYTPLAPTGRRQVVTAYGVAGRTLNALQTDVPTSVTMWSPDLVIIEMGCNDFGVTGVGGIGSAWAVAMAATLDNIHSGNPNAKVLVCSVTVRSEVTIAGPHFNEGTDTWAGNSDTQLVIAANNRSAFAEYVDVITPALAYSFVNNPPGSSTSPRYLTSDSLHQSNVGAIIMGTAVMQHLVVS